MTRAKQNKTKKTGYVPVVRWLRSLMGRHNAWGEAMAWEMSLKDRPEIEVSAEPLLLRRVWMRNARIGLLVNQPASRMVAAYQRDCWSVLSDDRGRVSSRGTAPDIKGDRWALLPTLEAPGSWCHAEVIVSAPVYSGVVLGPEGGLRHLEIAESLADQYKLRLYIFGEDKLP